MKTLICFGEDWNRHPSTLQFLAQRLSAHYRIIWVESLGLRRPRITKEDLARVWAKLRLRFVRKQKPRSSSNFTIYTPLVLPLHGHRWAQFVNRWIVRRNLRRLIQLDGGAEQPTVITACPSTEYLLGGLGEDGSVYYCADEYARMPGMDVELVNRLEARLLKKVDAIVATSEALYSKKAATGAIVKLLRHGVDVDEFGKAAGASVHPHPILGSVRHPIFGFYGLVRDIVDFELLAAVADRRPDWSIVLVGRVIDEGVRYPQRPNLHYFPAVPHEELPALVKGFDICLIPYRIDERTRDANPVKLREYLAAGKPILATALPEVMVYRDVVAIVHGADEFIAEAERLLAEPGEGAKKARIARVQKESWEAVSSEFRSILEDVKKQRHLRAHRN